MQQFKLNIVNRDKTGRGVARRLRAEGNIPGNIYSKGKARSVSLSVVDFREVNRQIGGGAALIELTDEKGVTALTHVQEIQRNAVKNCINHIDFYEVSRGESFVAHVPVLVVGEAEALGVKNEGGMIDNNAHDIEVRCRPSKLPEHIEVDVKHLAVGDMIHIRDLPEIDGVEYLGEPDQVVVSCLPPTVQVATTDADAADEVPASKVKEERSDAK